MKNMNCILFLSFFFKDAAALLQRRLETLSAEIGATQQQIHDIKVSEVGPSSGLEGGTAPPSQEMKLVTDKEFIAKKKMKIW